MPVPINHFRGAACSLAGILFIAVICAAAQETTLQLDPAKTSVHFTLDAALHTVHGTFQVRQSELQFDPHSGRVSGVVVVDAKSGETGNGMRDRKMQKDVLNSAAYPDISFHPDRLTGQIAMPGKSSVKVHGIFDIDGVNREIEVPAEVEISGDSWTATAHFTVPYVKWGMKNPSTLFLRVSDSVEVDVAAAGHITQANGAIHGTSQ